MQKTKQTVWLCNAEVKSGKLSLQPPIEGRFAQTLQGGRDKGEKGSRDRYFVPYNGRGKPDWKKARLNKNLGCYCGTYEESAKLYFEKIKKCTGIDIMECIDIFKNLSPDKTKGLTDETGKKDSEWHEIKGFEPDLSYGFNVQCGVSLPEPGKIAVVRYGDGLYCVAEIEEKYGWLGDKTHFSIKDGKESLMHINNGMKWRYL